MYRPVHQVKCSASGGRGRHPTMQSHDLIRKECTHVCDWWRWGVNCLIKVVGLCSYELNKSWMVQWVFIHKIMDNKQKSWPGILSMLLYNTVVISPGVCQYHYLVTWVYWLMEKRNSQLHNRSLSSNPGHNVVKAYTRGKLCVPQHTA